MCVSIYGYVYKSEGACEDQKWALDALGLELQSGEDSPVCVLGPLSEHWMLLATEPSL